MQQSTVKNNQHKLCIAFDFIIIKIYAFKFSEPPPPVQPVRLLKTHIF